ncbi:MAG TPA: SprT family zinc-dependent metalloprotease [Polyangiaceae bacterium]|nr:SprT family zinc-dependent metalloprotease [Polyangiaceae bacterium]
MTDTTTERSSVRYGTKTIDYAIRRSSRRTTVSIAIDPTDGVLVTAPEPAPIARLDRIVRAKGPWITQRLKRQSDRPAGPAPKEFVTGESFLYLGRQYRLKLELDAAPRPLRLEDGWLRVHVPRLLPVEHRSDFVRAALVDWYTAQARRRLPGRTLVWAKKVGVPAPDVVLAEPKKRWGSASTSGTIRLNWRIIQAPAAVVDYVVAHELTHLQHPNHTREFWAALGRAAPSYERYKLQLAKLGPRLEW